MRLPKVLAFFTLCSEIFPMEAYFPVWKTQEDEEEASEDKEKKPSIFNRS